MTIITRRSFLATTAAALFVPTIRLRREVNREALLAAFCDERSTVSRYSLEQPFVADKLAYATDGKFICRMEASGGEEINGERRLPKAAELYDQQYKPAGAWRVEGLPAIDDLTIGRNDHYPVCPGCGNRRVSLGKEYPDFNDPAVDAHVHRLDYDIDDNTIRDAACRVCHGLHYAGAWQHEICGVLMDYSRLKPIFALPGVQFAPGKKDGQLLFRAEGFEGIAMGMYLEREACQT